MDDRCAEGFVAGVMLASMIGMWVLMYFVCAGVNRLLPHPKENG